MATSVLRGVVVVLDAAMTQPGNRQHVRSLQRQSDCCRNMFRQQRLNRVLHPCANVPVRFLDGRLREGVRSERGGVRVIGAVVGGVSEIGVEGAALWRKNRLESAALDAELVRLPWFVAEFEARRRRSVLMLKASAFLRRVFSVVVPRPCRPGRRVERKRPDRHWSRSGRGVPMQTCVWPELRRTRSGRVDGRSGR